MKNKDIINWCYKKKQYELIEPNENLTEAYLIKAENSLKAMRNEKDNLEWEITTAYYTLYFSIYAIMMRIGIKCENHTCTIEFISTYLSEEFDLNDFILLQDARDLRNQVQYYVVNLEEIKDYKKVIGNVLDLYLKAKDILSNLNNKRVEEIRNNFKLNLQNGKNN